MKKKNSRASSGLFFLCFVFVFFCASQTRSCRRRRRRRRYSVFLSSLFENKRFEMVCQRLYGCEEARKKKKKKKRQITKKQPSEASPLCRRTALHYRSSVCPYLMATFSPIAGQYLSLQASPGGSQQLCNINSIFTSTPFSFFFFGTLPLPRT